ncbi:MAG TPA: hypothetical protein VFZ93_14255, partial [Albitalea sp.]
MATDPKTSRDDGSEWRPSGAESKGPARGQSGGHRSGAGTDYGDWVPDRGQPRRNDDRGAEPPMSDEAREAPLGRDAGSPDAPPDRKHDDPGRSTAADTPDATEAAAESNRNKDFDTPHVHSST